MADLQVVALIVAQPGEEDDVRTALTTLLHESTKEEGNRSYALTESLAAPGTFVTVETWVDQAALDTHLQTPHIAAALSAVGDKLASPPAIHPLRAIA